jgi:hypothetical protein
METEPPRTHSQGRRLGTRIQEAIMNIPVDKNRKWMAGLHESIDQLEEKQKAAILKPVGKTCALDLLKLCEDHLGRAIVTMEDLIDGWNILRQSRQLKGKWEIDGATIKGTFGECGCPLVRSGMIDLHPVQCYCSQGMMETIFAGVAKHSVTVDIKRSIGRGDSVCS